MKNLLSLLIFILCCNSQVFPQQKKPANNFVLNGSVPWKDNRPIWIKYSDSNGKIVQLKAYVKKGKFIFNGYISSPANFEFSDKSESANGFIGNDIANYANTLFLNPGVINAALKKNIFDHIEISGSIMQDDWDQLEKKLKPIYRMKDSLNRETNKIASGGNTTKNHAAVMTIGAKIDKCEKHERQLNYLFIITHPASYLSPYLTRYYFNGLRLLPLNIAREYYNKFTPEVKNSIAGRQLNRELKKRETSSMGDTAPLFTQKDINGNFIGLKQFRNKCYVILYFWASFTLPGKEGPHLKKLYEKYHSKGLDIIAISRDFSKNDWRKAIVQDSTSTVHHILAGYNDLFSKYDIDSTPPSFLFLIDKNGKVIGRYMGKHATWFSNGDNEGNMTDMDKKLTEVFGY